LLELREHSVQAGFIFDSLVGGREGAELIDVGTGGEGLVAGTLQDEHLDRAVIVSLVADLREQFVHLERERVAGLRAIECDSPDAISHLEK
jgi:hypothetical protein